MRGTDKQIQARRARRENTELLEHLYSEMHRLAIELHDGKYAPCQSEFILFAENVPTREALNRRFGRWEEFAALCDLPLASRKYYLARGRERQAEARAEVRMKMQEMRRAAAEAQIYEDGRGMPCAPRRKTIFNWRTRRAEDVLVYELI